MPTLTIGPKDSEENYPCQGDGDSSPVVLSCFESSPTDRHFAFGSSSSISSITLSPSGFSLQPSGPYVEDDTVMLSSVGIENLIGYFKVKSSVV